MKEDKIVSIERGYTPNSDNDSYGITSPVRIKSNTVLMMMPKPVGSSRVSIWSLTNNGTRPYTRSTTPVAKSTKETVNPKEKRNSG